MVCLPFLVAWSFFLCALGTEGSFSGEALSSTPSDIMRRLLQKMHYQTVVLPNKTALEVFIESRGVF